MTDLVAQVRRHLADNLAKALNELPTAYDRLPLFRLPNSRPNIGSIQHHSTDSTRSLVVLAVLDLTDTRTKPDADPTRQDYQLDKLAGARRQGVLPTLASWVRLVDSELWDEDIEHNPPDEHPTVSSECAWLWSHHNWIAEQQWLNEITDDLTGMLRDIKQVTADFEILSELRCLNRSCGWHVEEQAGGAWYRCTGCGDAWSRLELHKRAESKKPKSIAKCAEMAGVAEKTLRRYKAQGWLKVAQRDGKTELFDPDEVMELTMHLRYRQTTSA